MRYRLSPALTTPIEICGGGGGGGNVQGAKRPVGATRPGAKRLGAEMDYGHLNLVIWGNFCT